MPTDPHAVSSATVRRALEGAGPSLATQLQALTAEQRAGAGPLLQPTLDLVARTEASKAWALQAGAREGARLLYEAARTCLAAVEDYAPLVDWVREPEGLNDLRSRYGSLSARVHDLGGRFDRWPLLEREPGPALAQECLDIAKAMDPGFVMLALQQGLALMSVKRWSQAGVVFEQMLGDPDRDEFLIHHAARNALMSHSSAGTLAGRHDLIDELRAVTPDGGLVSFFSLDLCAAQHDLDGFDRAARELEDAKQASGARCERAWVEHRLADWSVALGRHVTELGESLLRGLH